MVSERVRAERYNLDFGTNVICNCSGTVVYKSSEGEEKELFTLEKNAGELLLTTEIRDENGDLLAKLRRNSFVYAREGFDAETFYDLGRHPPDTFVLTRNEDGKEIFKAKIIDNMNIQVTGVFHMGSQKIEATDDKLIIGTNELRNNVIEGFSGGGLLINESSMSIGHVESRNDPLNSEL